MSQEDGEYKSQLVHGNWIKIAAGTKRKPATILIAIPDSLAHGLMRDSMAGPFADLRITGLRLEWREHEVGKKKVLENPV